MKDDEGEQGGKHQGADHSSPYPVSRLAPAYDLVNAAKRIAEADQQIVSVTGGKLTVIADQIQALQEKAQLILEEAQRDLDLHRAECAFKPVPGKCYHLYRREDGRLLWMMVAPEDWGDKLPHAFVGSYRLHYDGSWIDEAASENERKVQLESVRALLEDGRLSKP